MGGSPSGTPPLPVVKVVVILIVATYTKREIEEKEQK
jgi:hypothetical protein